MSRRSKVIKKPVPSSEAVPPSQPNKAKTAARPTRANRSKESFITGRKNKSVRTVSLVALLLVAVLAFGFLVVSVVGQNLPWQYSEDISPAQAKKQLGSGAIVLDVRTYEEFIGGHIEKSLWMPLEQLTSLMQALPHDRLIITVCRSGVRSIQARNILLNAGWTQVTSMTGGIQAWIAAGYPTITGEPIRNN
jgi:rhodanese-related sulfurtransferase